MEHKVVYVNNAASTWPKPPEVLESVISSLHLPYLEEGRSTIEGLRNYPALARKTLGEFFRAKNEDSIIFSQNATDSLNSLIHGFCLKNTGPFHVITSDTEHNSVLRPLKTLESRGNIRLTIIPSHHGYISPESVETALQPDTRLAVLSHGSNVLGTVQDIHEIGEYLTDNNVMFIVDGAQTAGLIPLDFDRAPVDAFVFTGHKYLFGLPGIGGFLIKDPARIDPFKQGGTGVDSWNLFQPEEPPYKFEAGTPNYPGIVSLCAGTRYVADRGVVTVHENTMAMARSILDEIQGIKNVKIDNPAPDLPVISLNISPFDCDGAGFKLKRKYHIIVRTGLHCAPLIHQRINGGSGSIRISLSCLNTMEECSYVAGAIQEIAQSAGD